MVLYGGALNLWPLLGSVKRLLAGLAWPMVLNIKKFAATHNTLLLVTESWSSPWRSG